MKLINPKIEEFKYNDDLDISIKTILSFIDRHRSERLPMFSENEAFLLQTTTSSNDFLTEEENKKFVGVRHKNNIANIICNTHLNYVMGSCLNYYSDSEDKLSLEKFLEIRKINDGETIEKETEELAGQFGLAYQLCYINEDGYISYDCIKPQESFVIYNYNTRPEPIWGVRYYTNYNNKTVIELYGKYLNKIYEENGKGEYIVISEKENIFGMVQLIEYRNNKWMLCDFQPVKSHIWDIDKTKTTLSNLIHYINDAILLLTNVELDEEEFQKMLINKIMIFNSGSDGTEAKADFLKKPIDIEAIKEHLDGLLKGAFRDSFTPLVSSEELAKAPSAKALQTMYMATDFIAQNKQTYFRKGVKQLIKLIFKMLNFTKVDQTYSEYSIEPIFSTTLPTLTTAELEDLQKLKKIVNLSEQSLLELIPSKYVENVEEELERKKKEEQEYSYNLDNEDMV